MSAEQLDLWKFVLLVTSTLVAVIGSVIGLAKYFQERQRDRQVRQEELAWRKTQFVFTLANDFEKDEEHEVVWKLLTYGTALPTDSSLERVLETDTSDLSDKELNIRYAIDNYLDFFDRLSHFVYVAKSLKISDLEVFGWYIAQIGASREVHEYAESPGFDDVLMLSSDLRREFEKKPWYKAFRSR